MNVKTTQQTNAKATPDLWRREYIRLITETSEPWTELTPERAEELERIDDLIQAGYFKGQVMRDANNEPRGSVTSGPTLAGRIFAEEQQDILDSKSMWGRIKSGAGLFVGWLSGIISAIVIWYFTK